MSINDTVLLCADVCAVEVQFWIKYMILLGVAFNLQRAEHQLHWCLWQPESCSWARRLILAALSCLSNGEACGSNTCGSRTVGWVGPSPDPSENVWLVLVLITPTALVPESDAVPTTFQSYRVSWTDAGEFALETEFGVVECRHTFSAKPHHGDPSATEKKTTAYESLGGTEYRGSLVSRWQPALLEIATASWLR